MFGVFFTKELALLLQDRRYLVYAVFCVILVAGSFIMLMRQYQERHENYRGMESIFRKDAEGLTSCHALSNQGIKVPFAPPVLQVFAPGTQTRESQFSNINVAIWGKEPYPFVRTEGTGNPFLNFFPPLDFTLIVTFVLGLMVFIFSYNSVSRERETGTLRLILANRVSRASVILGKLAAGYAGILFPLIFALLLCILITQFASGFHLTAVHLILTGAIALSAALYLLTLYLLGIFLSVICRRSSTAIALLVMLWLIFTVVISSASIMVLERSSDPDYIPYTIQSNNERVGNTFKRLYEEGPAILGVESLNNVPWGKLSATKLQEYYAFRLRIVEEEIERIMDGYIRRLEKEERLLGKISILSPPLLYTAMVTDLAGTGLSSHITHLRSILDYQRRFEQALHDLSREGAVKDNRRFWAKVEQVIRQMPEYRMPETDVARSLKTAMPGFMVLCLYSVLFFMLAFTAFLRTDVR